MTAKNPRINITVDEPLLLFLNDMAKRRHKSVACLSRELIVEALELQEDYSLSKLADVRYDKNKKTVSHDEAWAK